MSRSSLIGLMMATMMEAAPFLDELSLEQVETRPFRLFRNEEVVLAVSGIGKANAAMATALSCQRFEPRWICNLGAAGATDQSHPLGEIYHVNSVVEFDRPIIGSSELRIKAPHILPGFQEAAVATQDKPIVDQEARRQIAPIAGLVDMEAASVMQACGRFDVPCVIFKFVSDTPDHPSHEVIEDHIQLYVAAFCRFFSQSVLPVLKST